MLDFLDRKLEIAQHTPMTKNLFPSRKFLLQENKVKRVVLDFFTALAGSFYSVVCNDRNSRLKT